MAKQIETVGQAAPKRYRSIAEVKRDLFPIAAAEERANLRARNYESLVVDLLHQRQASPKQPAS
jgi:hypothetical protein